MMNEKQALPSHAASKSTEKRPSANIETMTQFWLGRVTPGGKKPARATEYVPAVLLLFRLKYIQPPTSPEVENGGKKVVFAAEYAPVSGRPGAPGGAGETPPGALTIVAFSCSSKRTTSATARFELLTAAMPAPEHAPMVMPSRQILKLGLNAPVPPLIKRGAGDGGARTAPGREDELEVGQQRGREDAREVAAAGQARDVRVRVVRSRLRARGRVGWNRRVARRPARARRGSRRDRGAREDVVHVDALYVIARQEDVEVEGRERPVGPNDHVRDLRQIGDVHDREQRRARGGLGRLEVDLEVRQQQRGGRRRGGDVARVVVVRRRRKQPVVERGVRRHAKVLPGTGEGGACHQQDRHQHNESFHILSPTHQTFEFYRRLGFPSLHSRSHHLPVRFLRKLAPASGFRKIHHTCSGLSGRKLF